MGGTLVGGLVVGLVETLVTRYLGSQYADLFVFAALVVILFVRPAGLFVRARERVV
jgi:branched-chain amino acid transport system permease protein